MKGFNIKRNFYSLASEDGQNADIQMYGDVVETWPTDWWTGERIEGSFIAQDEFLSDLDKVANCKNVTVHISSYGGDCGVGFVIHNKLRELVAKGVNLTCIVDGVAMSAASVIMCAADTVKVNPSSLVMVHRCWSYLWGGYNADELRQQAEAQEAYDKAIVAAYKRKTGLSDTVLLHMMSDTTYLTGKEAVEKGFADELLDADPVAIAASADGRSLFINGKQMHLPGIFAPESIPTFDPAGKAEEINKETPVVTGSEEGGITTMTVDELRAQYPDLVADIEAAARASVDVSAAQTTAVNEERARMQAIDEVANLFDSDLVAEARYGDKACSAQELSYRAAQKAAKQGHQFLVDLENDNEASNANAVSSAPGNDDKAQDDSPENMKAAAQDAVQKFLNKEAKK